MNLGTRTSQRAIPIRRRADLVIKRVLYQGQPYVVVKDPIALEYFRLTLEQFRILELLDGQRGLTEIRQQLQAEFPTRRLSLLEVQRLIVDLHRKNLVLGDRLGQADVLLEQTRARKRRQVLGALKNVLYIRLPGWDPEILLSTIYPWFRWAFHPVTILIALTAIGFSWVFVMTHFAELTRRLPQFHQFFGWSNIASLWMTIGIAKLIHELAHGLACRHFRGECHSIGVAFLVFSPCLYCDISDSWMLSNKWKRIAISSAGMFVELVISAFALMVWWNTQPGLWHYLGLNVFLVTTLTTVVANANPLLKFDGYYILSDLIEIPNLRGKSDSLPAQTFAQVCWEFGRRRMCLLRQNVAAGLSLMRSLQPVIDGFSCLRSPCSYIDN